MHCILAIGNCENGPEDRFDWFRLVTTTVVEPSVDPRSQTLGRMAKINVAFRPFALMRMIGLITSFTNESGNGVLSR
jgi:hypothetical protein